MLGINILIKYSKSSPLGTFDLGDYIQFTLSAGTYSIDDFNGKIKAAFLRQKQNWEPPLRLVYPTTILKKLT